MANILIKGQCESCGGDYCHDPQKQGHQLMGIQAGVDILYICNQCGGTKRIHYTLIPSFSLSRPFSCQQGKGEVNP